MVNKAKLENVGETEEADVNMDTVFEDQTPEQLDAGAAFDQTNEENDANSESEAPADDAETEADLEAAGVNIDEAAEEKVRNREKKALMTAVRQYGAIHGGGKKSMIQLAERVTEAAMKHAIDNSNVKEIYDEFKEAADKKGQLEDAGLVPDEAMMEKAPVGTNEDSYNSQISKLGHFITLGNKFDTAGDLVRRVRNIHIELLKGDRSTLKVGSTYSIMSQMASVNHKRNLTQGVMSDDEIRGWLFVPKRTPEAVTGPKKILDALLAAESARKGTNDREGVDNPHLDQAINELRAALGDVGRELLEAHDKEVADAEAKRVEAADKKAQRIAEAAKNKGKGRKKAA